MNKRYKNSITKYIIIIPIISLILLSVILIFFATLILPISGILKSEFFPGGDVPFIFANVELENDATKEDTHLYLKEAMKTMEVKTHNMQSACEVGHLSATDLADYLVEKCDIPFREAHFITGRAVAKGEEVNIDLSKMDYKYLF